jgi:hypothetical protein
MRAHSLIGDASYHMTGTLRVILELEPDALPIQGRVGLEGGVSRRFDGYVELIGVLETFHGGRPSPLVGPGEPAEPGC